MNRIQKITVSITGIFIVLLALVGLTYAYFLTRIKGNEEEKSITVVTGNLELEFDDGINIIRASGLVPIQREQVLSHAAKKQFTIKNTGTLKAFVDITLDDIELPSQLKRFDFLYALYEVVDGVEKNITNGSFEYVENSFDVINHQVFEIPVVSEDTTIYDEKTYNLYIWIEETNTDQSSMMEQNFSATISVTGRPYSESPASCFTFENGTITGYDEKTCGTDVIIPETIGGFDVTTIGINAFYRKGLTSVVIPNSVTSIELFAFLENNLTNVIIPNSISSFGNGAFMYNNLTNVVIPNNVTSIGDAFNENNLTNVVIPNSVISIDDYAFSGNDLTSVIIPNSVTIIGKRAFQGNELTNVIIPNSVTSIGESAFGGNNLTNIIISNSVTSIGVAAFENNNLTSVIIPDSVTSIGWGAFMYNPNLTSIVIKRPSAEGMTLDNGWNISEFNPEGYKYINVIYDPNY